MLTLPVQQFLIKRGAGPDDQSATVVLAYRSADRRDAVLRMLSVDAAMVSLGVLFAAEESASMELDVSSVQDAINGGNAVDLDALATQAALVPVLQAQLSLGVQAAPQQGA